MNEHVKFHTFIYNGKIDIFCSFRFFFRKPVIQNTRREIVIKKGNLEVNDE